MKLQKTCFVCTLILISIQCSLSAAWYESNILGQKIRQIDESEKNEFPYILEEKVENSTISSSLFFQEKNIKNIEEMSDGDKKTITITEFENNIQESVKTTYYDKGLPISIEETIDGQLYETLFRYENGQLVEKKEITDGIMNNLITYWRNSDGSLALSREIQLDKENLISFYSHDKDSIIITQQSNEDVVKKTLHPSYVVTSEFSVEGKTLQTQKTEVDEQGRLIINEKINDDEIQTIYSVDGVLLEKHIISSTDEMQNFFYEYDEKGTLIHSTEIITLQKVERIERYYTNGELKSKTEFIDEMPIKSTRYNQDGTSIVTLFEENRPYADVTYALDGKRVLSIEYRKEQ